MRCASLLLALIALAACASGSDEEQIEGVVREYLSGIQEGNGEQTCDALSGPYRDQLLRDQYEGGCESRVKKYGDGLSEEERQAFKETKVTKVQLDGDQKAFARTKSPTPHEDFVGDAAFNMRKFDGEWKIDSNNEFEAIEHP